MKRIVKGTAVDALRWWCLALGLLLSGTSFAQSNDAPPAAAEDAAEATAGDDDSYKPAKGKKKPFYSARLRLEYDYRSQGESEDSDFYGRLYGNARDLRDGRLDIYLSGRMHSDLDEAESTSLADDPFRSVDDSNGVTEDRLLQFYGDAHTRDKRLALRAGRQYIEVADYLQLDGAQLMMNESGTFGGRLYLGHPVSYYTSVSDDYAGGFSLVGRPWTGNRSRLTLSRYHDESEDGEDDNYFFDVQQQITETSRVRGQLSLLNEEYRMGRIDWFSFSEDGETDFSLGASYWGSFDAETRAYSPLYNVLGEQDPYTYTYARLTQQLVPGWLVSPGVSLRFADQSDENDYNNRDYENYDIALIYAPTRAFSASVSLEHWAVEDDDSFFGVSGELRYRKGRSWEVSGGASFAEYTYDTYSDISYTANGGQTVFAESGTIIEESPYVYTYFIRGKCKLTRRVTLRLQFDIEDDDSAEDLAYRGRGSIEIRY